MSRGGGQHETTVLAHHAQIFQGSPKKIEVLTTAPIMRGSCHGFRRGEDDCNDCRCCTSSESSPPNSAMQAVASLSSAHATVSCRQIARRWLQMPDDARMCICQRGAGTSCLNKQHVLPRTWSAGFALCLVAARKSIGLFCLLCSSHLAHGLDNQRRYQLLLASHDSIGQQLEGFGMEDGESGIGLWQGTARFSQFD